MQMSDNGILLVNKHKDMTSHDLVNITRRAFGTKKVGHNGTLDPDATGVMVLSINKATRLNEYLVYDSKSYRATVLFGQETNTQDISGEVTKQCDLPSLDKYAFVDVLKSFLGKQKQIPPMYSAIKKNGKPLYKYAREGVEIGDIPPRDIEIFSIDCIEYSRQEAVFEVSCSKGTYIRALCQDLARKCGSCGCMSALTRTREGKFKLEDCVDIETLKETQNPTELLIPSHQALDFPKIIISDDATIKDLFNGKAIKIDAEFSNNNNSDVYCQAVYEDELISIGKIESAMFVPKKVFHI